MISWTAHQVCPQCRLYPAKSKNIAKLAERQQGTGSRQLLPPNASPSIFRTFRTPLYHIKARRQAALTWTSHSTGTMGIPHTRRISIYHPLPLLLSIGLTVRLKRRISHVLKLLAVANDMIPLAPYPALDLHHPTMAETAHSRLLPNHSTSHKLTSALV